MSELNIEAIPEDLEDIRTYLDIDDYPPNKIWCRQCQVCRRPTAGHPAPGYGPKRCHLPQIDKAEQKRLIGELQKIDHFSKNIEKIIVEQESACKKTNICVHCRKEFDSRQDLKEHRMRDHGSNSCDHCEFESDDIVKLRQQKSTDSSSVTAVKQHLEEKWS